ncbi:MAG: 23S rRNA pseudouridine synthase F [Nitrospira sp. NTP1]|nr:23S rRNA pseudouridine synthase F [Nitrospira sp. NTP1]
MRINKFFTEQGLCSRREADRLVAEGRVTINGVVAKLGDQVSPQDIVARDGTILQPGNRAVYIKYHKPVGVTTTTELQVPRNIITEINHRERIFPIGRLDKDSSGLILVDHEFDDAFLSRMAEGVVILGERTRPCLMARLGPRRFRIILTEGRNRQIRRMCQALGYRVVSLHRVRIMHITVEGLHAGQWMDLTQEERRRLFEALGRPPESSM